MPDEETVREIVRDELQSQSSTTRRGVLAMLGGGAAAGAMAGSASGEVTSDQALSVGDVTANTYRISENRYGGVESARSELATELGSSDAGAKFVAQDTGAEYHWTGSAWELMDGKTKSFSTEQASHNIASAGGGRFRVYEDSNGEYVAAAKDGSVEYRESTNGIGELITAISDDLNPNGITTDGEYATITLDVQSREQRYEWGETGIVRNGTVFSITSSGQLGAIFEWTGPSTDEIFHYQGNPDIATENIGYRYNAVNLSNFGVLWNEDRNADVLRIEYANTLTASTLYGHFTKIDASHRSKNNEDVGVVPSGDHFFLTEGENTGFSEYRHLSNMWILGAPRGIRLGGDHSRMESVQVFYANPPTDTGAIVCDTAGGGNDTTLINCQIFESGAHGFELPADHDVTTFINCEVEDPTPNGYNAQQGGLYIESADAPVLWIQGKLGGNYAPFSGDKSRLMRLAGDTIQAKMIPDVQDHNDDTTTTVSAGGTVNISTGVSDGRRMMGTPVVRAASDPGDDFGLDPQLWYDKANEDWKIRVTETEGLTSVEVYWWLFQYQTFWW